MSFFLVLAQVGRSSAQEIRFQDLPPDWDAGEAISDVYNEALEQALNDRYPSRAVLDTLLTHKGRAVEDLPKYLKAETQAEFEQAVLVADLLIKLGSPLGWDFLREQLESGSSKNRLWILRCNLPWRSSGNLPKANIPLFASLLQDSDQGVRSEALGYLVGVPELATTALKLLEEDISLPSRGTLIWRLCSSNPTRVEALQLLDLARRGLSSGRDVEILLGALGVLSVHPDVTVSTNAAAALNAAFTALTGNQRENQGILRRVKDYLFDESLPLLAAVVDQARDPFSRGYALETIARLRRAEALPLLLENVNKPHMREACVNGFAYAVTDENRDAIVDALEDSFAKRPAGNLELLYLLEHGGESGRIILDKERSKLPPEARMHVEWKLNKWTLEDLAAGLKEAGLIRAVPDAAWMEHCRAGFNENYGEDERFESQNALFLLKDLGLLHWFDSEADELPVRHDFLIKKLAVISGGKFQPQAVRQRWLQKSKEDRDAPYLLEFVCDGKRVSFQADNRSDWYDLESLQLALNSVLVRKNAPERYLTLEFFDQVVYCVFGDPVAWEKIRDRFYIPVERLASRASQPAKNF